MTLRQWMNRYRVPNGAICEPFDSGWDCLAIYKSPMPDGGLNDLDLIDDYFVDKDNKFLKDCFVLYKKRAFEKFERFKDWPKNKNLN